MSSENAPLDVKAELETLAALLHPPQWQGKDPRDLTPAEAQAAVTWLQQHAHGGPVVGLFGMDSIAHAHGGRLRVRRIVGVNLELV